MCAKALWQGEHEEFGELKEDSVDDIDSRAEGEREVGKE
jgi:hypothetical protein